MSADETAVARLRGLETAATPGPWDFGSWDDPSDARRVMGDGGEAMVVDTSGTWRDYENAAFIAEARNALPGLLDEVERLRGQLARVEALADEWFASLPETYSTTAHARAIHCRELRAALEDR